MTLRERFAEVFQEHSYAVIDGRPGKPGDWAGRIIALMDEGEAADDDPFCDSEIWSWTYFRSSQVDPYWIRCDLVGPHNKHQDSNTGAKWTDEDAV